MFNFCANVFGYLLNAIYNVVNNYGLAIIIFTIILKVVMLPVSIKQQRTLKKTSKLQAQVKEIQVKYSNDQVRQSQELMDLYKRENMSPFSGCLGSIVQFIIILSVFYLISSPLTYMKHVDPELLNKYTQQIQENTDEAIRYREIAIIKEMSDVDEKVRLNMDFLGLDLSDVPSQNYSDWKVFIIPGLYVLTSLLSMKLTTMLTKKTENKEIIVQETPKEKEEDAMEEMNRQLNLMMPIMTVSIALIAPLGLALYWLVSNLLMIGERLIMNKLFKEEE